MANTFFDYTMNSTEQAYDSLRLFACGVLGINTNGVTYPTPKFYEDEKDSIYEENA